jgi:hypothetical protein
MSEIAVGFLFGVIMSAGAGVVLWFTSDRHRVQPLVKERYDATLRVLYEALKARESGDLTALQDAVNVHMIVLGEAALGSIFSLARRRELSPEEFLDSLTNIICDVRSDLGLPPVAKEKVTRILRLDPNV